MSSLDITFCTNKKCLLKNKCKRSIIHIQQLSAIVSQAEFAQDTKGHCDMYMSKLPY